MPRRIVSLHRHWLFSHADDLDQEVLGYGNINFVANETRTWQKAGNHSISRIDNPHVDTWRTVHLPHDFVLEGPFTRAASLSNGSLLGGKAWYVRRFDLPAEAAGQRVHIAFDGVYRDCQVFCNGHFVGRHLSGYTSFCLDLTEVCEFGQQNAIAVLVDATENEQWSYEGGGIYRTVRLLLTDPLHIPQWGIRVRPGTTDTTIGRTLVDIDLRNAGPDAADLELHCQLIDPDGQSIDSGSVALSLAAWQTHRASLTLDAGDPLRWRLEAPRLYTLRTQIRQHGECLDQLDQTFGYRTIRFDPDTGFHLNGQAIKLKGTCCHQDHAGVGIAVPPALHAWRVQRLQAMGCNAIRTAHHPPDPALLDACDRLGMLVMDEIRLPGIAAELISDVADTIRRDRHDPSVILWSLGNEEIRIQDQPAGPRLFRRLLDLARQLDPDRPTTYGMNCNWLEISDLYADQKPRFDVFGANYRSGQDSANYDRFHQRHPDWPLIGCETWGGGATRGLYEPEHHPTYDVTIGERWNHPDGGWIDDRRYVSAYGNWHTAWGYSLEECWRDCLERPFMAGTFIWTGFDYRGETSPYTWPAVITRYGLHDNCGFPKELAHYLRAWWRPDVPHLFLIPHWTWPAKEGQPILVRCYSNAAEIQLFLNGQEIARQSMPPHGKLEWPVPYEAGELSAVGYDEAGNRVAACTRRTAGPATRLRLTSSRDTYHADDQDSAVIDVAVIDHQGEVCPRADHPITFQVEGSGTILGVGNGNPISHEPATRTRARRAYHGLCQLLVRLQDTAGPLLVHATSPDLEEATLHLQAID